MIDRAAAHRGQPLWPQAGPHSTTWGSCSFEMAIFSMATMWYTMHGTWYTVYQASNSLVSTLHHGMAALSTLHSLLDPPRRPIRVPQGSGAWSGCLLLFCPLLLQLLLAISGSEHGRGGWTPQLLDHAAGIRMQLEPSASMRRRLHHHMPDGRRRTSPRLLSAPLRPSPALLSAAASTRTARFYERHRAALAAQHGRAMRRA